MQQEIFPILEQQKAWKALNPAGTDGCVRGGLLSSDKETGRLAE